MQFIYKFRKGLFLKNADKIENLLASTLDGKILKITKLLSVIHDTGIYEIMIPEGVEEIKADKMKFRFSKLPVVIKFPSTLRGDINIGIDKQLEIIELDFGECEGITGIASLGLANLTLNRLIMPNKELYSSFGSLKNSSIKETNLKLFNIDAYSLFNADIPDLVLSDTIKYCAYSLCGFNAARKLVLKLSNDLMESSIGDITHSIYLPVSMSYYRDTMKNFLSICRDELHSRDHKILTKEERNDSIDFFLYYAQNEIDFSDDAPDEYYLYKEGGYQPIKYSKFKNIKRHGILLWLSTIICRKEMTVEEREYKESLQNGLYNLFTVGATDERDVYLYNQDLNDIEIGSREYTLYLSSESSDKGRMNIYVDQMVLSQINNKEYSPYKPSADKSI